MSNYIIFTDSSADLDAKLISDWGLEVQPLTFKMTDSDTNYANWPDERDISLADFYTKLRQGVSSTTSQVNVGDFTSTFRPLLEKGIDILYLAFSSGLSGTMNSGRLAAEELSEEFPDRKILVVDTLCASLGQGLIIHYAVQQKKDGKSMEEVAKWVEDNKLKVAHYFTVDDLNFLKRGGRLSGTAAFFGTMLHIKPVLHVNDEGRLVALEKVRGRKQSLLSLIGHIENDAVDPQNQPIFISHGDCLEDAQFVADEIKQRFSTKEIYISTVGPVIGSHAGPGTMAVFFLANNR